MTKLRPMTPSDVPRVIQIIDMTDDDDAEAAEANYTGAGIDDQFVFTFEDKVVGVTGFRKIEDTERAYWLSWTYLDEAYQGKGFGKTMLESLISKLHEINARKIFVKISDYQDPQKGKIYEAAMGLYQSIGFQIELTHKDYYNVNENLTILGLELSPADVKNQAPVRDENVIVQFDEWFEIFDTSGSYSFSWFAQDASLENHLKHFDEADLQIGINGAKSCGARKIFLSFPSNYPSVHGPLKNAGFNLSGKLRDFYNESLHELHFEFNISKTN